MDPFDCNQVTPLQRSGRCQVPSNWKEGKYELEKGKELQYESVQNVMNCAIQYYGKFIAIFPNETLPCPVKALATFANPARGRAPTRSRRRRWRAPLTEF